MRVEGDIHIGEANRWASRACARLNGNSWLNLLLGLALGAAAGGAGILAAGATVGSAAAPAWLYLPIFFAVAAPAWILAIRLLRSMMVARFRRNLLARGVRNPLPWVVQVEDDYLTIRIGVVETRTPWSAVSEVFPVGPYWVFLVQGTATFVPKRTFGSFAQERAFLAEIVKRLDPVSRRRSPEAERFAAS
jgi:hypothetical protein